MRTAIYISIIVESKNITKYYLRKEVKLPPTGCKMPHLWTHRSTHTTLVCSLSLAWMYYTRLYLYAKRLPFYTYVCSRPIKKTKYGVARVWKRFNYVSVKSPLDSKHDRAVEGSKYSKLEQYRQSRHLSSDKKIWLHSTWLGMFKLGFRHFHVHQEMYF